MQWLHPIYDKLLETVGDNEIYHSMEFVSIVEIIKEMLRRDTVRQKDRNWKVLIMDRLAIRIISAARKMHDVMSEGVTSKDSSRVIHPIKHCPF